MSGKAKPKKVTKAIMIEVADRLGAGENLLKIVEDEHMPSYRAITSAVARDDEMHEIYRQGRILQAEYHADRINSLAEEPLPTVHPDGTPVDGRWLSAEVQRRKCEIDTLKWTFARLQPFGIRDKKEDVPQQQAITISWAPDGPKVEEKK